MPPRGVKSAKRERQYEHIKQSYKKRGKGEDTAEEIAARTVNKTRREKGETKGSSKKKSSSRKSSSRSSSSRSSSKKKSTSSRSRSSSSSRSKKK